MRKKIIVVGAGITGLYITAKLLESGFEVQLLEQAPQLRHEGGGLGIYPPAVKFLKNFGDKKLQTLSGSLENFTYATVDGQPLPPLPVETFAVQDGILNMFIVRAELQNLLAESIPKNIIFFNSKFVNIEQNEKVATVELEDGSKLSADCVIAADGIFSKIRNRLFPDYRLNYTKTIVLVGIVDNSDLLPKNNFVLGVNRLSLLIPVGNNRSYSFMQRPLEPGLLQSQYNTPEKQLELFSGYAKEVDIIIDHLHRSLRDEKLRQHFFCQEIYDADIYPEWFKGRTVLVGESAHPIGPILGVGTSMSLSSAHTLVTSLIAHPNDLQTAFTEYQSVQQMKFEPLLNLERMECANILNPSAADFNHRLEVMRTTELKVLFAPLTEALMKL